MANATRKTVPVEDRFWSKVDKTGDCWVWTASVNYAGYGRFSLVSQPCGYVPAHRFSYELAYGPIPTGMLICHRCDNPPCVNPAHLFVGSHQDNMDDMNAKGRRRAKSLTHCPNGHEYTPENTKWHPHGYRRCGTCRVESAKRCYERKLARRAGGSE